MTEDQLRAITDAEMRTAVGYWSGRLAQMRQQAMYYYLAEPKGDLAPPEVEGRSAVVSPDVRNTIEAMLPQLMAKFAGTDTVVEFEPTKPGDEGAAEQATDFINYLYNVKNSGERISYTWMKDALLSKNGIVKVWWDDRHEEKREDYIGLTQVELAQLMDDSEVEVIEQKSYADPDDVKQRQQALEQLQAQLDQALDAAKQDPMAAQAVPQLKQQMAQIQAAPPVLLYDVSCKRRMEGGHVCVENVPPEEFLISRKAKNIQDAPFVAHRVARTRSELASMGYKNLDNIAGDDNATALNMERIERLSWDDELAYLNVDQPNSLDQSQQIIWVTECYVRCDYDDDGIAELRKVVRAGNQILENEIVDCAPFVSICPVHLPHKFFGMSVADLSIEAQKVKTSLLRSMLDNMYLQVNGRYFAVDGQVNLDDLLTSRPGGVVRVKQPGAVGRLDQAVGDANAMAMMQYMQGFLEDSSGWSRQSQGNDASPLTDPMTATQANIVTNRADMRLDLIARSFAHGFRDLFKMMLKLVCQYQQKEATIKLRGQWVNINPREWRNGFETTINVGLGTGNRDQQVAHLMALLAQQQQGLAIGTAQPPQVYEAQKELAKALGFKSGDKFFSDPRQSPPPAPPPTPEQIRAQTALQLKQMELAADAQKFQAETQLELQKIQAQTQAKIQESQAALQVQASNDQRDAEREQTRIAMEAQLKAQQAEFERWKAQLEAETKVLVAQIAAQAKEQESPAEQLAEGGVEEPSPNLALAAALQGFTEALNQMRAPRTIIRGPDGRAQGIA